MKKKINLGEAGIYLIINTTNQKTYVGQSVNLDKRRIQHTKSLKTNKHWNQNLQKDYFKGDRFVFKPVKNYSIKNLNKMEMFWIKKLDAFKGFGYNGTDGGDSFGIGKNHPMYDNTIYNFDHTDGETFIGTQYALRMKCDLDQRHLSSVCLGKKVSIKGWGLEGWKKKLKNKDYIIYNFENINGKRIRCTQSYLRMKYDLNGGHLSAVCSSKRKSHKGWKIINISEDKDIG